MINFLTGKTGNGIGNFSEFQIFSRILDSLPSLDDQLTYALSDPSFPTQGDLGRMFWLLSHPNVCKISFEELIGPHGGGSEEAATPGRDPHRRIPRRPAEVESVLPRLYNREVSRSSRARPRPGVMSSRPITGAWPKNGSENCSPLYGYR